MNEETNGETVEIEIPPLTAPLFPVERTLNNSLTFYQRTVGGGMIVKIVALIATPAGNVPSPEATCVAFSAEGWERFKREVAADGEQSRVEVARHIPEGFPNGAH